MRPTPVGPPQVQGSPLDCRVCERSSALLPYADLWVHGHSHDAFDYRVGTCRVVANPAGYVLNRSNAVSPGAFQFENNRFDKKWAVEL